jgi:hypothetical protein
MVRLLADENFNGDIVRGLLLRRPDLDIVRVQDVGLSGADDPAVLAWAANEGRILLTHDKATMPDHAYARIGEGLPMPGMFVIARRLSAGQCIEELLVIDTASEQAEWADRVLFLPL